ncbi:MAG TPA: TIGR04283 family arsenosugar biosynthesis glycosyltransferase [Alphaproteobacteria bacterium]|nr:TIGR04283 family arsenosugar biosynthesis glycosyltransferase [Alphaproteobacteria bacterium]
MTRDPNQSRPTPRLSIVIPALDAAAVLGATLESLAQGAARLPAEILLVDGGSRDATRAIAIAHGARVIAAEANRGAQLAAGAEVGAAPWLLFLHADTLLEPGWEREVDRFIAPPANHRRAAAFRLAFDDESAAARRLERLAAWRGRALGLPYGDQGLLIARPFYRSLGGYRPLALMEDVELVRRVGRRRLVFFASRAVTSAARYQEGGWLLRPLRNLLCLTLYFLGVPPRLIARLYA